MKKILSTSSDTKAFTCIAAALLTHIFVLLCINNIEISSTSPRGRVAVETTFSDPNTLLEAKKQEGLNKEQILAQAFKNLEAKKAGVKTPPSKHDSVELLQEQLPELEPEIIAAPENLFPTLEEASLENLTKSSLSQETSLQSLALTIDELTPKTLESPSQIEEQSLLSDMLKETDSAATELFEKNSSESKTAPAGSEGEALKDLPDSEMVASNGKHYNSDQIGTIASSEDFRVETFFAPRIHGNGYFFKLVFHPKEEIVFSRIKQNFFFLLDRSHSIPKKRYAHNKQAVLDALEHLHPEDTFNILVFDDEVVSFHDSSLSPTRENLIKAHKFLNNQAYGGLFASTDLYSSLDKIIPSNVEKNEVNTAILLSDGDTSLKKEDQRTTIGSWTLRNRGKISLFTFASGGGNNLNLLDLISIYNKGWLTYTQKDQGVRTGMADLMLEIQNPIGKDITATTVTSDPATAMTIFPKNRRLHNLYQNKPFVLVGTVSDLQGFHVFLQGKYYDRWLDIKQHITFKDAISMHYNEISKEIDIHSAYDHYDKFLVDGKSVHLIHAKNILKKRGLSVAFE